MPHHLIDVADPWEDYTLARFAAEARRAVAAIEARGQRALLVGGTGLYLRAVVDDLAVPGRYPEVPPRSRPSPTRSPSITGWPRSIPWPPGAWSRPTAGRVVRALEVTLGSGRPFSSYGPGLDAYPPSRFHLVGVTLPHEAVSARIEARYRQQMADGFLAEVRRLLEDPRGCRAPPGRRSATASSTTTCGGELDLDEALELAMRRTRRFARRQRSWFRRDPRIRWLAALDDPRTLLPGLVAELAAAGGATGRAT